MNKNSTENYVNVNSNTTYKELLENLFDGVYYVDTKRIISFWNKAAERITGYKEDEVLGCSCANNILQHIDASGNELCLVGCPLHATLKDGEMREQSLFLHHKKGHRVPVHIRISPVKNEKGEVIGGIEVFSDNSQTIETLAELEKIKQESYIDPLLKIGNRRYAEMIFKTRFYELQVFNVPFGVILLDIDRFKQVNDKYGHNIGDDVLIMVTRSVQAILRNLDTIIRWGGDEIMVFLPNVTREGMEDIAERIRIFVEKSFLMLDGEKVFVTVSLGGTFATAKDTLETVISRADELMYASKEKGGNLITIAK